MTSGSTPNFCMMRRPISTCVPCTSWSTAFPRSWRSDHAGDVRHFDRVLKHVLAIARAEMEASEDSYHLRRKVDDTAFIGRLLALFLDDLIDVRLRLFDDTFDLGRLD